jgi:hypothetical protein
VNILNNLRDNLLYYHGSKHSADHIFAFYLTVVEANSFSAYCKFVPEKKNMKHVDFHKQLARSIFDCYSDNTIADQTKKRQKRDSDNFEHHLTNLSNGSATSKLKSKYVQRRCINCYKHITTCCSCTVSRGMCTDCWA